VRDACREENPRSDIAREILKVRAKGERFVNLALNIYVEPILRVKKRKAVEI
jgi:hypothetical protein